MAELDAKTLEEVQQVLDAARSQLAEVTKESSELERRLREVDKKREMVERQVWLAELLVAGYKSTGKKPNFLKGPPPSKKSIADASAEIMKSASRMLTAREIVDALAERGRVFKGKTSPTTILTTTLKRHPERFFCRKYDGMNRFGLIKKDEVAADRETD